MNSGARPAGKRGVWIHIWVAGRIEEWIEGLMDICMGC